MHALVITTDYPFPTRNGVTIPVANYVLMLQTMGWTVDIVVVGGGRQKPSGEFNGRTLYLDTSKTKWRAALGEIFMRAPFCCNFKVHPENWKETFLAPAYELILCSPITVLGLGNETLRHIGERQRVAPRFVAAINDCYTAELRNVDPSGKWRWLSAIGPRRLRSLYMGRLERALLLPSDEIFVQTRGDRAWLERLGEGLAAKVSIVMNGVDDSLFEVKNAKGSPARRFCFVADFRSPVYRRKLLWLHRSVWKNLDWEDKQLHVIGRGVPQDDPAFRDLLSDRTIVYKGEFIEKIGDIYEGMDVAFAPVFTNHGFVNKVGEAMAAGVAVIGDASAFEALDGFVAGEDALVADTAPAMMESARKLYQSGALLDKLKQNGKALAEKSLRWSDRRVVLSKYQPGAECRQ